MRRATLSTSFRDLIGACVHSLNKGKAVYGQLSRVWRSSELCFHLPYTPALGATNAVLGEQHPPHNDGKSGDALPMDDRKKRGGTEMAAE
jgi:hypothetical protein